LLSIKIVATASQGPGLHAQREGMGLLENQAMPSLREVAHGGWLCTYVNSYNITTEYIFYKR
jgi:hypothetical protein